MAKFVFSRIMWVGRATVFLVGLAVILALTVGLAAAALAGTGVGDTFNLGKKNTVNRLSQLVGNTDNAMLRIDNNSGGAGATALNLQVEPGITPMKVNSSTQVVGFNADLLDGRSAASFVSSNVYKAEDPPSVGTLLGDGTRFIDKSCNAGDQLLSGGPANINTGTILLESFPTPGSTNSWRARIQNDGTLDSFNVVVLCANQ